MTTSSRLQPKLAQINQRRTLTLPWDPNCRSIAVPGRTGQTCRFAANQSRDVVRHTTGENRSVLFRATIYSWKEFCLNFNPLEPKLFSRPLWSVYFWIVLQYLCRIVNSKVYCNDIKNAIRALNVCFSVKFYEISWAKRDIIERKHLVQVLNQIVTKKQKLFCKRISSRR